MNKLKKALFPLFVIILLGGAVGVIILDAMKSSMKSSKKIEKNTKHSKNETKQKKKGKENGKKQQKTQLLKELEELEGNKQSKEKLDYAKAKLSDKKTQNKSVKEENNETTKEEKNKTASPINYKRINNERNKKINYYYHNYDYGYSKYSQYNKKLLRKKDEGEEKGKVEIEMNWDNLILKVGNEVLRPQRVKGN